MSPSTSITRLSSQRMCLRRSRSTGPAVVRLGQSLPFGPQHLQQLAPPRHHRRQRLVSPLGSRRGIGCTRAPNSASSARRWRRSSPCAPSPGQARTWRGFACDRQRGRGARRRDRPLVAAGGLHDNQLRALAPPTASRSSSIAPGSVALVQRSWLGSAPSTNSAFAHVDPHHHAFSIHHASLGHRGSRPYASWGSRPFQLFGMTMTDRGAL